jgi:hypothetical protein
MSIVMPQSVLKRVRARDAVLLVSMRNVYLWTHYTGTDPEASSAQGYPLIEGYGENAQQPPPKYFIVRLSLGM